MAYSEREKDKILLNLKIEKAKKKGKSKWYINLLYSLVILLSLAWLFFCAWALAGGFCMQWGISYHWMWLLIPLFAIAIVFAFKWKREWEREKWEEIEKPEYERKTGKGQFANYFVCSGCDKEYRVNAEYERGKCRGCSGKH